MSFKPERYKYGNQPQREYVMEIMGEFSHNFKWKNDGTDTLLDIGCGDGSVTYKYLHSIMPYNYGKLVGLDISEYMVNYARRNYQSEKIKFYRVDIAGEFKNIKDVYKFDHVTSFFTLHWVTNLRKAISNISEYLTDDGDCIITFPPWTIFFAFYSVMAKTIKWNPYVTEKVPLLPSVETDEIMCKQFKFYLKEFGFKKIDFRIKYVNIEFESLQKYQNFFEGFNPFHEKIPANLREEFFLEFLQFKNNYNVAMGNGDINNLQDRLLWGYASK